MSLVKTHLQSFQAMLSYLNVSGKQAFILVSLGIVYAGFEGVGVGMLLPLLQYLEQGSAVVEGGGDSPIGRIAAFPRQNFGLSLGLPVLFLLILCPILMRQLFRLWYQIYGRKIWFEAMARLRREGFYRLVDANLPFFVAEGHGRMVAALTTEVERGTVVLPYLLQLCEHVMLLTVYLSLLVFLAPWLFPFTLVALVVVSLLVRAKLKHSLAYGEKISLLNESFHTMIGERLAGIRLLKLRGQVAAESKKLKEMVNSMASSQVQICRLKEYLEISIAPVMVVSAFATLYIAISWFGMSLASLGVYMVILLRIDPLFRQLNAARQGINAHFESLNRVHNMFTRAKDAKEIKGGPKTFLGLQQDLVFDRVGFYYDMPDDGWSLREVTFRAPKGTLTAIVGPSGSGKSTLLDLVPRLREVSSGDITIDGVSVKEFDLLSLRAAIGVLDHHGFLINDTVENNISYGLPKFTRADVMQAAKRAYAHQFIEQLPKGYDTITGEMGARLSMGQRQRICLARALLQDPDILLLDEPTSALDSESEQYIQAVLEELREHKVIIVVAHRLSTVRRADQILVVENGQIVERGDHRDLLNCQGSYRRLFNFQLQA